MAEILDGKTRDRLRRARKTGRLSPIVAVLATSVFGEGSAQAEAVALALSQELKGATSASLRALDRDFRSPAFLTQWHTSSALSSDQWGRFESLSGEAQLTALAIASIGRAGRIREAACRHLERRPEPLCFALLVLRLNDSFASTREVARAALQSWLTPSQVIRVSHYSPLLESASQWQWAGNTRVSSAFFGILDRNEDVLWAQSKHGDPRVRLSAYTRLALVRAGTDAIEDVLRPALVDVVPQVRVWARNATKAKGVPTSVRIRLARVMWEDPSPRARELALRLLRGAEDMESMLHAAAFDGNAGVRFAARAHAQKLRLVFPYRQDALTALQRGERLIGALALLSDHGGSQDVAAVRPFAEHRNKRVRLEARRTLRVLLA